MNASSGNGVNGDGRLSVMHCIAPGAFGGLETVVRSLAEGALRQHHDVHVAAVVEDREGTHPYVQELRGAGVPVTPLVVRPRHYLAECNMLFRLFRERRPDVVHTHGYRSDVLAGGMARRRRTPTVTTVHGFTGGDRKNRLYERLQRRAFRRCDAVVAVSRPLEAMLLADGVRRERLHLVRNALPPIDGLLPRAEARAALGLPGDRGGFGIAWLGRLSAEKGADILVEAIARLNRSDVWTSVIGDGPMRAGLEERSRTLGLTDAICWHGTVMGAARLLRAFDLVVLSSRTEGTPIVLLEAMQVGLPVVATAVGGVPDVLDEGAGWLVPPERPDALAEAIAGAVDDPAARTARGEGARLRWEREFSPDPWLRRYEDIYRGVLRARGRG